MKRFVSVVISLCVSIYVALVFFPTRAIASGEFTADYDVEYAVSPAGKTIVTQRVTLTNLLSNFYPQRYSLLLDTDKIANVIAYDDGGIITPVLSVKDGKTTIALTFNTKAIGVGKSQTFSLRYEHSGVASQNGSIWEINIPGIVNDPDIDLYDVTLSVPPTFGPVAYLSPLPASGRKWTKDQMIRGGISGAYGTMQNFDVNLTYFLTNPSVVPATQEIALPPDTAYQKVVVSSLDPKPDTVIRDEDDNWIARYTLLPAQTITVKTKLIVSIFLTPQQTFSQSPVDVGKYLKPLTYWEVTDPKIQALAQTLRTPRQIYDYVVSTLSYDYSRVSLNTKRFGAVAALAAPKTAICMEFTDLFIALARAAGIPARRAVGFAYTNNPRLRPLSLVSDVLHAWPEYYDAIQHLWIPVDPTWANTTGGVDYFTKLDFNHIVFALNGLNSSEPYPAGFYKKGDTASKDVFVQFAASPPAQPQSTITTTVEFPKHVSAATTVAGRIKLQNQGGTSVYNVSLSALSDIGGIQLVQNVPEVLPYGTVTVPFQGTFPQTLKRLPGVLRINVDETQTLYPFDVQPLYLLFIGGALFLVSLVLLAVFGIRRLLWKRRLKKQ